MGLMSRQKQEQEGMLQAIAAGQFDSSFLCLGYIG